MKLNRAEKELIELEQVMNKRLAEEKERLLKNTFNKKEIESEISI